MKTKLKLKKGDTVWAKIPVNAKIKRVNQRYGYTLETEDGVETCYFGEDEVVLVQSAKIRSVGKVN